MLENIVTNSSEEHFVMYFIIPENLNMSPGKIASQCCHGIQMMLEQYHQWFAYMNNDMELNKKNKLLRICFWLTQKIDDARYTKIILEADEKEWKKLKEKYDGIIIKDAGKTEVEPGTDTVMVLYPMLKSERDGLLKRLRLLK